MKRILLFAITFLISIILLAGCGDDTNRDNLETQEGTIVEIKENEDSWDQILIVPNATDEDISDKEDDELRELAQENDGAYYGLEPGKYEELEVGTHVTVYWNGDQTDSDPPQREAKDMDISSK